MNVKEWTKRRIKLHWLFGGAAVALAIMALWAVWRLFTVDRAMEIYDLSKGTTQLASTLFFGKLTAIAQVTIAIVGGTWALLIFADRSQVTKGFKRKYFVLANISFAASLLIYSVGYDFIVERLFHHGAFDVDAPFITAIRNWQLAFFLMGCADLVGTAISQKADV
jgi:hypothetical protein